MAWHTVYVTRRIWPEARAQLEDVGTVICWDEERPVPHDELLRHIENIDALLCTPDDQIDREVIEHGVRLKVISTLSIGVDHIDLQAAAERGIIVCHTPGAAESAVADLTLTLLLSCARYTVDADAFVKNREWQYWYPDLFLGTEMQGSTLGLIGLGHIGIQVAHRALGFGMRVLYFDRNRNIDAEQRMGIQYGSLENVLREADFVTLHIPLTAETRGIIDATRLRLMKPTAYLINVARGAVVDHDALVTALREGWIAGAGLDVYEREPIAPDDPLLTLPNVVLTPHIGANTRLAMASMMREAAEQLIQALNGERPAHTVDPPRKAA